MPYRKLIDDVNIRPPYSDFGPPICFPNALTRRMLGLAKAGEDDVVWDLGCGWAQTLIIAATELGVKKCVGIERLRQRYQKAKERVSQRSLSDKITLIESSFENFIDSRHKGTRIEDATIVIYLLETDAELIEQLSRKLKEGCRLVYYYNCLTPEILPDAVDHPFYVSSFPFRKPKSALEWLRAVVKKRRSTLADGELPGEQELWDELSHDYHILGLSRNYVKRYRTRLHQAKAV